MHENDPLRIFYQDIPVAAHLDAGDQILVVVCQVHQQPKGLIRAAGSAKSQTGVAVGQHGLERPLPLLVHRIQKDLGDLLLLKLDQHRSVRGGQTEVIYEALVLLGIGLKQ